MFAQISQLRRLALLLCVALPRAVVAVSLAITGGWDDCAMCAERGTIIAKPG